MVGTQRPGQKVRAEDGNRAETGLQWVDVSYTVTCQCGYYHLYLETQGVAASSARPPRHQDACEGGCGCGRRPAEGGHDHDNVLTCVNVYLRIDAGHLKPDERIRGQGKSLCRHPVSGHSITNLEIK